MLTRVSTIACALLCSTGVLLSAQGAAQQSDPQSFKFRTGVELINVNATVTDQSGRFVSGLAKDDLRLLDEEQPQAVTHFSAERVPVSLGIVLDTSGSMDGDKMIAAKQALERFLVQLLDPEDEVFLYRFDNNPELVEGWTRDKRRISESLYRIQPRGGTALYDAVADAVHLAQQGHNKKKAVMYVSRGQFITQLAQRTQPPRFPVPLPFPMPGGRKPAPAPPPTVPKPPPSGPIPGSGATGGSRSRSGSEDRVNVAALRDITDDSGGRTEIIRWPRDLDPATAGIADELSKQYYLGYAASGAKDGRWHSIRVEVRNPSYHVRARRGYVAGR